MHRRSLEGNNPVGWGMQRSLSSLFIASILLLQVRPVSSWRKDGVSSDDTGYDRGLAADSDAVVKRHFRRVFGSSSSSSSSSSSNSLLLLLPNVPAYYDINDNNNDNSQQRKKEEMRREWQRVERKRRRRRRRRRLDDNNKNDDDYYADDYYRYDDDQPNDDAYNDNYNDQNNQNNGNQGAGGDDGDDAYKKFVSKDNEACAKYLVSFLGGTTDARDTCEGIWNAYISADCKAEDYESSDQYDDIDDYFEEFAEHTCCETLITHHAEYCDENELLSNFNLFLATVVLLLCEVAKFTVRRYNIHFIPEAASCIFVGTLIGLVYHLLPFSANISDISFDDELLLALLLPPIIFEAALSVSKYEFRRRRGAIFMFSVFGTCISTFSTGFMVHYGSRLVDSAQTFPMLDSLVFGALISSIDPVAILSVLTSLNLNQKDTIFILVFGESLLNDGIAITLFQTLVNRFDGRTNDGSTSVDEVLDAAASFLIAMFGSIFVGVACGCGAWAYFYLLDGRLPPVMEVGSFFLWALIPYYLADAVQWSGIVSIVAVGFFLDIYIAGPKELTDDVLHEKSASPSPPPPPPPPEGYKDMKEDAAPAAELRNPTESFEGLGSNSVEPLPRTERIHLSEVADKHIRFVAHLTSQLAENAIFAYLGLFLFSSNYNWDPTLMAISIVSCVLSRTLMVVVVSTILVQIYSCRGRLGDVGLNSSRTAQAIQDRRTQAVLVLAGLRGAVSLALVENIPIYNNVTGQGCEFKPLMKGMTSAAILFTTFVMGGGAYYVLPYLTKQRIPDAIAATAPPPQVVLSKEML